MQEKRQSRGEDAFDLLLQNFVPCNESSKVAKVRGLNKAEEPAYGTNPFSNLEGMLEETKRASTLCENPARDMLHLLYQVPGSLHSIWLPTHYS